jgi:low affinity Fe/Cu permease
MEKRLSERRFHRSKFDRFAEAASGFAGRGAFFTGCVAILLVWLVSYPVIGSTDTWQLIVNTITTIITFLLVALLENSQRRTEFAMHTKLNALADALADLMEHQATGDAGDLMEDMEDLRVAAGLEEQT